ncbi:hypothetical protein Tco_0996860 [Tanacetum coccineum]
MSHTWWPARYSKLEKEHDKYVIIVSSLYNKDRQYTKNIKEQEDSHDKLSGQLAEMNDTVLKLQTNILDNQKRISELEECVRKKDFENEHLKSKVGDFTTFQTLRAQVKEIKSKNDGLKLSVEELTKARELVEVTLRQRDEMVYD